MSDPNIDNVDVQFLTDEIAVSFDIQDADPGVYNAVLKHRGVSWDRTVTVNGTRKSLGVKLHYKIDLSTCDPNQAFMFDLKPVPSTTGITGDVDQEQNGQSKTTPESKKDAYERAMRSI